MKLDAKSIEEFFVAAGEREPDLRILDELIRTSAPSLKPYFMNTTSMAGLAYGSYHYKYASGREGDWCIIGLAPQKNYMSLYICIGKGGKYLPELYSDKLGKVSCGRSCIRFKKIENLDLEMVRQICREAEVLSKDPANFQM
jgi:hypothetical protein